MVLGGEKFKMKMPGGDEAKYEVGDHVDVPGEKKDFYKVETSDGVGGVMSSEKIKERLLIEKLQYVDIGRRLILKEKEGEKEVNFLAVEGDKVRIEVKIQGGDRLKEELVSADQLFLPDSDYTKKAA